MLRWMAIVLAGMISLQSLHISPGDITALDDLVEHYRFHQDQYGDDLLTFITKHYGNEAGSGMDHTDEEHHRGLPFQHSCITIYGPLAFVQPTEIHFNIPEAHQVIKDNFYIPLYSTLFVNKTFQPPKHS